MFALVIGSNFESNILNVIFLNLQKIYFEESLSSLKLIKQIIYHRQQILILDAHFIKNSSFFWTNNTWASSDETLNLIKTLIQ